MRLLSIHVENFGSYKELDFSFDRLGLSLVYGPTGSGKSTVLDMATWVMFGCTAKDGAADDVRSWVTKEATEGELHVQTNDKETIVITRRRGADKDLYWRDASGSGIQRGKDLIDTQKLLEARLGVSKELYLTGAYFHEFSGTGSFFMAKSRERRQLLEQIADVRLAEKLGIRASETRKKDKKIVDDNRSNLSRMGGSFKQILQNREYVLEQEEKWRVDCSVEIETIRIRKEHFESEKKSKIQSLHTRRDAWEARYCEKTDKILSKIDKLNTKIVALRGVGIILDKLLSEIKELESTVCEYCGGPAEAKLKAKLLEDARIIEDKRRINDGYMADKVRLIEELDAHQAETNPYAEQAVAAETEENHWAIRLKETLKETNPFSDQLVSLDHQVKDQQRELDELKLKEKELSTRLSSLDLLYDLSNTLRGELVKKAVSEIEKSTNSYLEKFFDSELRVNFILQGSDNLEVEIQKSGYDCTYRQLSKGQRGLLKLCFAVSVMKAASNTAGVHFENLFFDESLDGLDANLKVKAFSLFQELDKEHESILLIDHATEFQEMFDRRFKVRMNSDISEIEEVGV